jgi:uncharacterized protein YdeI (BOF family)
MELKKKYLLTLTMGGVIAVGSVPAMSAEPVAGKPDDSWITVRGTVASADNDSFVLDYGEGLVTVEMDDWDWYSQSAALIEGDQVTVNGRIDDDLFEARSIEASSVYVDDLNTYFYDASAADEEDVVATYIYYEHPPLDDSWVSVSGTVQNIKGRELVLDTGDSTVRVDTVAMAYNPVDNTGYQQIEKGDRIAVTGSLDLDFFEKREIQADTILSLSPEEVS